MKDKGQNPEPENLENSSENVSDVASASTESVSSTESLSGSEQSIQSIRDRLNKLYYTVEKPLENAAHNVTHKLEDQLPDDLKKYSALIVSLVSVTSFSFLILGISRLFRPKVVERNNMQ